jgi:hypothetical protein
VITTTAEGVPADDFEQFIPNERRTEEGKEEGAAKSRGLEPPRLSVESCTDDPEDTTTDGVEGPIRMLALSVCDQASGRGREPHLVFLISEPGHLSLLVSSR